MSGYRPTIRPGIFPPPKDGPVAQLDRALASGARGRAFESRRAHSSKFCLAIGHRCARRSVFSPSLRCIGGGGILTAHADTSASRSRPPPGSIGPVGVRASERLDAGACHESCSHMRECAEISATGPPCARRAARRVQRALVEWKSGTLRALRTWRRLSTEPRLHYRRIHAVGRCTQRRASARNRGPRRLAR